LPERFSKRGCIAHTSRIGRGEAARDGELRALRVEHFVHGRLERGTGRSPRAWRAFDCREHFVPEQRGEQEGRRHRPAGEHALVGLREREGDEALAERLLEDHVEQRQESLVQPHLAQLPQAGAGVAGEQQLEHLVEQGAPAARAP
jgi:hypothetical protein